MLYVGLRCVRCVACCRGVASTSRKSKKSRIVTAAGASDEPLPPALAYFLNTAFTPGMYLSYPSRARNRSNQGRRPPQQKRAAARQMTRGEGPHRARARASVRAGERSVGPTHLSRLFLISGFMNVSPRNESVTNSLAVRMLLTTNSSSPAPAAHRRALLGERAHAQWQGTPPHPRGGVPSAAMCVREMNGGRTGSHAGGLRSVLRVARCMLHAACCTLRVARCVLHGTGSHAGQLVVLRL